MYSLKLIMAKECCDHVDSHGVVAIVNKRICDKNIELILNNF